jgi:short-subunit dehydrogenase
MEVNFFAPVELTRAALPQLRLSAHPIVVNIGSVLGQCAVPWKSEYCASKFALHGFSDSLRAELDSQGIDVLVVSPSTTDTEFFDSAMGAPGRTTFRMSMSAEAVARATVRAIRKGRKAIILSWGGRVFVWSNRVCPSLIRQLLARFAAKFS